MKCDKHRWPRAGFDFSSIRSNGETKITRCNDCLAVRVEQSWHVEEDGKWVKKSKETIVENPCLPRKNENE